MPESEYFFGFSATWVLSTVNPDDVRKIVGVILLLSCHFTGDSLLGVHQDFVPENLTGHRADLVGVRVR